MYNRFKLEVRVVFDINFHCDEASNFQNNIDVRAFTYKNYTINMHNHDFYEINVIMSGKGIHCLAEGKISVSVGDVFVIPPMVPHAYIETEELEVYHILLKKTFISENKEEFEQINGFIQLMEIEPFLRSNFTNCFFLKLNHRQLLQFKDEMEFIDDSVQQGNINSTYIKYHSIWKLIYWFSGLLIEQKNDNKKSIANKYELEILKVLEYIHQHYFESITIDILCKQTYMSRSTLLRNFKDLCGISPNQYINNYRCKKALELFETLKYTKTEIAHLCGFYDYSHMERGLKKYSSFEEK